MYSRWQVSMTTITIGTRTSKLAMWQSKAVAAMLEKNGLETEIAGMETRGDKILDTSIAKIGSKGVFTEELEEQLVAGVTDIAVHSAKDMQSVLSDEFELIAFTRREKANDILISDMRNFNINDTSEVVRVGTSSVRRTALLKHYYPHLEPVEMRGNLQTRIGKMRAGACDVLMLAYAGVKRMGYLDMLVHIFPETEFIPPVGQGCIAVEAAKTLAPEKKELIRKNVNDSDAETCLVAERAFLRTLEGGCSIPAFGHATILNGELSIVGGIVSLDGATLLCKTETGASAAPEEVGCRLGEAVLADGGKEMLVAIRNEQRC